MKIFTLIFVGALATALGCQAADAPVATAPEQAATQERVANNPALSEAEDHDHKESDEKEAPRITLSDAKKAFDNEEAVFVDTRSAALYQNEHVKGAINLPSSDFDSKYESVPKDKKIITYCS